jgi:hypothetical protein
VSSTCCATPPAQTTSVSPTGPQDSFSVVAASPDSLPNQNASAASPESWAAIGHSSRFSFRFPHCVSLRDRSKTRSTCRFSALNMPMRACISGPRSSAAINSASIAACHSSDCRVLPGGKAMMYLAASLSVRSVLPPGMLIGSSKRRDHGISSSAGRSSDAPSAICVSI